ncbi:cytochrome c [Rhodosalinus sediminis]|uniref:Cytochrome c n=1 Tax=Rhodosalinus sediminis TaxID=1940533 RepID=A0A3D9BYR6_9RHOB|nr:cytochrome c [Rhodosalinus sediminis]REC58638.1 cytochrome c [Rhodosalinus sediminis]
MKTTTFAACLFAALPGLAAADGLEDIAEARRGYYKLLGSDMAALAAMAKGEVEYDAAVAETRARNMQILTTYDRAGLYVPGTSTADLPGETRALPAIWEDMAGVQEDGKAFVAAVEELQAAAGEGRAALGAAVQKVGGTCKSCHDDYRAKDF